MQHKISVKFSFDSGTTNGKISGSQENSYGLQWDAYIVTQGIFLVMAYFLRAFRCLSSIFIWYMVIIRVITSLYMDSTVLLVEDLNLIVFVHTSSYTTIHHTIYKKIIKKLGIKSKSSSNSLSLN